MKTFNIIVIVTVVCVGTANYAHAQNAVRRDSAEIAMEHKTLSQSLANLRDSISNTITVLEDKKKNASSKSKSSITQAVRDLSAYRQRIDVDLEDVNLASKKGWDEENAKRLRVNLGEARREFNRILKEVKPHLASRS